MLYNTKSVNYLSLIPVRAVEEFTETEERITLLIPKFKHRIFQKLFIPRHKSPHFRIHLDSIGSQVWRQIDGLQSVEMICSKLHEGLADEMLSINQLEERVTTFLTELYKSRFVTFKGKIL